ncbi:hypothetical protein J31TS4_09830 [Paenibacillus sp. J31TS4]|uniref:glycosyl hydrolase family 18 protein n=1 Tax=Paenibacillus sp. J31TS4 TaxID=2807195 RepID=UPI001B23A71B|nr:glycosyl hydrolase family 18 protein [Paenibacillus sp. J31TS4]GIP37703.1 hypothetical protein J31TS4_09830 [Paenibacillus sp. J31TS4]
MVRKKTVLLAAVGLLLAGSATADAYESRLVPFRDVSGDVWSAESIYTLAAVQALDGYEDGSFGPVVPMTKEEFVKLLAASAQTEPAASGATGLADVAADRWSYGYIAAALNGHWADELVDGEGKFRPTAAIRREEAAYAMGSLLLQRLPEAERKEWQDGGWREQRKLSGFPDDRLVDEELAPAVYYAVRGGMLEGNTGGLDPDSPLTRQEAAALIHRLLRQEADRRPLEVTGFYAIQSFGSIGKLPLLDQVALGWWHLQYDGPGQATLGSAGDPFKFNVPEGWEQVTAAASQSGIGKQLTVFANKSHGLEAFLDDAAARQAFVTSLASALNDPRYGFSGLCIDFEDLYTEDRRDAFTSFLKEVKGILNGRTLTVAVPPAFYYKGYDLKAIGETADSVLLMAYQFLHKPDRLPSSPFPLAAEAVRDTLAAGVPADKLVLGIGKQTDQFIERDGEMAYASPTTDKVEARLRQPGVLQTLSVPYLLSRITYMDQGAHELFYEDADSIGRKLWLARYYGLKGVSLWYMGQFAESDWTRIEQERRGS